MSELFERLIGLEADTMYQEPAALHEPAIRYLPGRRPFLISAPHGAACLRGGEVCEEDEYTAALARLLGEECDVHVLYARRRLDWDPAIEASEPYKAFLAEVVKKQDIRFVLDLHGASAPRNYGFALGTHYGKSCPHLHEVIVETLHRHGFSQEGHGLSRLDLDRAQPATHKYSVTRFASEELGVPAAQLFINGYLRIVRRFKDATRCSPFRGDPTLINRSVTCLQDLVEAIDRTATPFDRRGEGTSDGSGEAC